MPLKLENVSSERGAPMGRRDILPENRKTTGLLHLQRLKWVDHDYDSGGAYWGGGSTLGDIYCAYGDLKDEEFTTRIFVRAKTRDEAKVKVREIVPNVTFYR